MTTIRRMDEAPRDGRAVLLIYDDMSGVVACRWGDYEDPRYSGQAWFWADYSDVNGEKDSEYFGWLDLPEDVTLLACSAYAKSPEREKGNAERETVEGVETGV